MSNGGEVFEAGSREPIRYSTVLVVEGRDTFGFFRALSKELGLQNQIEVRNGGGLPDLYDYLQILQNIAGFDAVASLGVVCDADADPHAAFTKLCNALSRANLPVPVAALQSTASPPLPRVAVAILPDPNTPGMLETLLWRSLAGNPVVPYVEQYLDCIRKQTGQAVKYEDKSRIHTYIAGRDQPWLLTGQACHARHFPWDSPVFDEIKAFLQVLIGGTP